MPIFRSLAAFKRSFQGGPNTGRPDDGTFDLEWITSRQNAWRLAEGEFVPFTETIKKGKYDRDLAGLLAHLEPGSLPLGGAYPVIDVHAWLVLLHQAFGSPGAIREQANVTIEHVVRTLFAYALRLELSRGWRISRPERSWRWEPAGATGQRCWECEFRAHIVR